MDVQVILLSLLNELKDSLKKKKKNTNKLSIETRKYNWIWTCTCKFNYCIYWLYDDYLKVIIWSLSLWVDSGVETASHGTLSDKSSECPVKLYSKYMCMESMTRENRSKYPAVCIMFPQLCGQTQLLDEIVIIAWIWKTLRGQHYHSLLIGKQIPREEEVGKTLAKGGGAIHPPPQNETLLMSLLSAYTQFHMID